MEVVEAEDGVVDGIRRNRLVSNIDVHVFVRVVICLLVLWE